MSPEENGTPQAGDDTQNDQEQPQQETFDAEYVSKLRKEAAKHRAEARDASKRLAEIEDRDKSEAQRAADKIEKLEAEVPAATTAAFRQAAIALGDITPDDAELMLTGSDVETLAKQLGRLTANRSSDQQKLIIQDEGNNPRPKVDEEQAAVRELFQSP